jgi:biotin carboxyl carrier protein
MMRRSDLDDIAALVRALDAAPECDLTRRAEGGLLRVRRIAGPGGTRALRAPGAGLVRRVLDGGAFAGPEAGAAVEPGRILCLIESRGRRLALRAPAAGTLVGPGPAEGAEARAGEILWRLRAGG